MAFAHFPATGAHPTPDHFSLCVAEHYPMSYTRHTEDEHRSPWLGFHTQTVGKHCDAG